MGKSPCISRRRTNEDTEQNLPARAAARRHFAAFACAATVGDGVTSTPAATTAQATTSADKARTTSTPAATRRATAVPTDKARATSTPAATKRATAVPTDKARATSTPAATSDEAGTYTTKGDVALYLHLYGHLPDNFITKSEARSLGWEGGSLEEYAPGKCIGGDRFGNYEGLLPEAKGRTYTEMRHRHPARPPAARSASCSQTTA